MFEYHYGIPGFLIWIFHIIIGLVLFYLGYKIINNQPISQFYALTLIVTGTLAIAYHAHLMFVNMN